MSTGGGDGPDPWAPVVWAPPGAPTPPPVPAPHEVRASNPPPPAAAPVEAAEDEAPDEAPLPLAPVEPALAPRGPVVGAVLVGGSSRRMGIDKALMQIDGVPMARIVANMLRLAGAERIVVIGSDRSLIHELVFDGVDDRWPSVGPLGGIATAVLDSWPERTRPLSGRPAPAGHAEEVVVLVAACDQPDLRPSLLSSLVAALRAAPPTVGSAAPRTTDGRVHPFPAAYRASTGGALAELVETGARRADAGLQRVGVVHVEADARELADLDDQADVSAREARGALHDESAGALVWGAEPAPIVQPTARLEPEAYETPPALVWGVAPTPDPLHDGP